MDVKLNHLIEKIKKEGIEEGRQSADQIVKDAQTEAKSTIEKARKDAEHILAIAKKEADQFQSNSELAVKQAARDSILQLKGQVSALFDRVFRKSVAEVLTPDVMKEMVLKLAAEWGKDESVEVVLSAADQKKLEGVLSAGIRKEIEAGVTLKASGDVSGGFQIGLKGKNVYYDFTDESIADALKQFLKPQLKKLLDGGNG
jgi:V/A-type H+-transporting ATPase subunit E